MPLLEIRDLRISFAVEGARVSALAGINLMFEAGKVVGIVGESGSGKSVTALSILRLLPKNSRIDSGQILLYQPDRMIDLAALPPDSRTMNSIRGGEIGIIFQEPMAAFSPVHTIGSHLVEAIRLHRNVSPKVARDLGVELLDKVGIADPARRFNQYAFELSGGMRQRAMIALALSGSPRLLIADEPTTALDVTIQAQILELLLDIQAETGMAIMFITHDLGVIAQLADEIAVMYLGKVVEYGTRYDIFDDPKHPYTANLLQAVIRSDDRARLTAIPGQIPSPFDRPQGCPFHTRCIHRIAGRCDVREPALIHIGDRHAAACVLYESAP